MKLVWFVLAKQPFLYLIHAPLLVATALVYPRGKESYVPPLGVAVTGKASSEYSSSQLVQDFVFYTADLSTEEAAGLASVSTATLTRWRMMGARQLRADVRRRLERYVAQREKKPRGQQAA